MPMGEILLDEVNKIIITQQLAQNSETDFAWTPDPSAIRGAIERRGQRDGLATPPLQPVHRASDRQLEAKVRYL